MTRVVNIAQSGGNNVTMRNRIINGAMVIDQRYAGGTIGPITGSAYTLDRWNLVRVGGTSTLTPQQSTIAPTGFVNSLIVTVGSGATPSGTEERSIFQRIEGLNCSDLSWGTANAQPVTLSFWVRSSVTGTYGVVLGNSAFTRSYVASYTINAANTWEQKTVTVAGDTSGTWLTSNGVGIAIYWDLGVGTTYSGPATGAWQGAGYEGLTGGTKLSATSGATWYITGVQLEAGTTATPFEQRLYGTELALCQRYYEKSYNIDVVPGSGSAQGYYEANCTSYANGFAYGPGVRFSVPKRSTPTISFWNYNGTANTWLYERSGATGNSTATTGMLGHNGFGPRIDVGAAWVVCLINGQWTASAEL